MTRTLANNLSKCAGISVYVFSLHRRQSSLEGESGFHASVQLSEDRIRGPFLGKGRLFSKLSSLLSLLLIYFQYRQFLRRNKIDVLILQSDSIAGMVSAWSCGTKFVVQDHFQFSYQSKALRFGRKFTSIFASQYVALTDDYAASFKRSLHPRCCVSSIPNPLETQSSPSAYHSSSKILLSAGHINDFKGFDLLLVIAEKVFKEHPDWRWVICGDGPNYNKISDGIKRLKLEDNVFLVGRVSRMADYYSKAALYVLTSRTECLPTVLLEAQQFGIPTVGFDVSAGVRSIIDHARNGLLIEPFKTDDMANQIIGLINDPARRSEFSSEASKGLQRFHPESINRQWIDLLENL